MGSIPTVGSEASRSYSSTRSEREAYIFVVLGSNPSGSTHKNVESSSKPVRVNERQVGSRVATARLMLPHISP